MKNLEMLGVQEMNTVEMKKQSGGGPWDDLWCDFRDKVVNNTVELVKKEVKKVAANVSQCGDIVCLK